MLDWHQNYIGRFERRHQGLLKARPRRDVTAWGWKATETAPGRCGGVRLGTHFCGNSGPLPIQPIQHATNTAATWRTS